MAYVHTAPDHYKRRVVIRQTWGDPSYYDVGIRVVFVMGRTAAANGGADRDVQRALQFEAAQYGDIVQEVRGRFTPALTGAEFCNDCGHVMSVCLSVRSHFRIHIYINFIMRTVVEHEGLNARPYAASCIFLSEPNLLHRFHQFLPLAVSCCSKSRLVLALCCYFSGAGSPG